MRASLFFCNVISVLRAAMAALVIALASPALASGINVSNGGIAIDGHDPVAYFTLNQATPGNEAITATHQGATYRFVSADNKALFEADPDKYAPQYGGYCAYGASQGYKAPVEADKFSIVDGKLYLNYNGRVQSTWRKDTAGYIDKADAFWATQ
jgi:YHS domain-containing protein